MDNVRVVRRDNGEPQFQTSGILDDPLNVLGIRKVVISLGSVGIGFHKTLIVRPHLFRPEP